MGRAVGACGVGVREQAQARWEERVGAMGVAVTALVVMVEGMAPQTLAATLPWPLHPNPSLFSPQVAPPFKSSPAFKESAMAARTP